jgi:hypothetical protein
MSHRLTTREHYERHCPETLEALTRPEREQIAELKRRNAALVLQLVRRTEDGPPFESEAAEAAHQSARQDGIAITRDQTRRMLQSFFRVIDGANRT